MNFRNVLFFAILILLIIVVQCGEQKGELTQIKQVVTPLENSWDYAVPHQEIPEGLTSLSAESCGTCHQEHYEEWKYSTHSHAWTDLQFQAELKKETSPFMCINCHIPLQNQQEYIIKGLINGDIYQPVKEKNPHFDKALQQEGINCASCHVRNNVIVGPTGTDKAPHATVKDTVHLSEQLCISCHNAVAVVTPTLACTFESGDEWKAGPYSEEKNCISCHMDTVTRAIVPGYEERKSHRHFFPGSGIPKFSDVETKMLNGLSFSPDSVADLYFMKDGFNFEFKIKNELAGHKVPTGDPERFIIFTFTVTDELDSTVYVQIERLGEHWEWFPKAKKISDNNLLPKEERIYTVKHSFEKTGEYKLNIEVTKHRAKQEAADFNHLGDDYPLFISVYNKNFSFEVK
jgi:hypothetical protein